MSAFIKTPGTTYLKCVHLLYVNYTSIKLIKISTVIPISDFNYCRLLDSQSFKGAILAVD